MDIDHIFIFSANRGSEAAQLIDFGLVEGSSRAHPGQGTTNRKFYFENFFLELLWVSNENEIKSKRTGPTLLWERSVRGNQYSPFGLCLHNNEASRDLFKESDSYNPVYFPKEKTIDIIKNEKAGSLPWTFRLPQIEAPSKSAKEPTHHRNGIKRLTNAFFGVKSEHLSHPFTSFFESDENIGFFESEHDHLMLAFDDGERNEEIYFEDLALTIHY